MKATILLACSLYGIFIVINAVTAFITRPIPNNSYLLWWFSVYFVISYIRIYAPNVTANKKLNIALAVGGILLFVLSVLVVHFLGLKWDVFAHRIANFDGFCKLFFSLSVFGLLNLFGRWKFKSKTINYVSSLSMLIYIIHENLLFRKITRPYIWNWIYVNLGYNLLPLWVLLYVLILFVGSFLVATLYRYSLERVVHWVADKLHALLTKIGKRAIDTLDNKVC